MANKMSRWQRLRLAGRIAFGRRGVRTQQRRQKQFPLIWPNFRSEKIEWQLIDYGSLVKDGYSINSIIYSAIAYKWRQVANAPLTAFSRGENNSLQVVDPGHPMAQLLRRPNSSMTGIELLQMVEMYLNIAGNAYTVITRDSSGNPAGLFPLRPDRIFIVRIKEPEVMITYWYQPSGAARNLKDMVPILSDDMIHNKFPNPLDDLEGFGYGMSPLAPLAQSADVDNEITRFLKEFFEHGAVPPGYISFDTELEEDIMEEVGDRWMEQHGGTERWVDVAVFEQGGKYIPITPPFKDMGFEVIDERNEARILGPLGVPPILIGSRSGTAINAYGTATRQERLRFWEDTMIPELRQIDGEFTNRLGGDDLVIASDFSQVPALVDRNVDRVTAMATLINTGTPRNAAYQLVGLPPVVTPHGDVSWMPANMQPYTDETPLPDPTISQTTGQQQAAALPDTPNPKVLPEKTENGKRLPEHFFRTAMAIYDSEIAASTKGRRTFDWEALPYVWMAAFCDEPDGGQYIAILSGFAEWGYSSGLTGYQGRAHLTEMLG